jgi:hypothetical protein
MTINTNSLIRSAAASFGEIPGQRTGARPPLTMEECLQRVESLGQRINGYVQFMCKIRDWEGASAEAKGKAVAAFCERITVLERALGRIEEQLRLG